MKVSAHYKYDRRIRNELIHEIGIGEVIYSTVQYDSKRGRYYRYEITDNAILIIKATDADLIITQMVARPSRILAYWKEAPKDLIMLAVQHCRKEMYI